MRVARDGEEFLFRTRGPEMDRLTTIISTTLDPNERVRAIRAAGELEHAEWQDVMVSWHPPSTPPEGRRHGAAGVCFAEGQVVLISNDGMSWEWPGGRPEGNEDWQE